MRIKSNSKIFFNILGLPCSGTTIVSKFFDSLENGFCLSEPLHTEERKARSFISEMKKEFLQSDFLIGGMKEVFINDVGRDRLKDIKENSDLFDLSIVVLRDPIENISAIYSRMKKRRSKEDFLKNLIISYERLFEFIQAQNSSIVLYERFCNDPIGEANRVSSNFLKVEGVFSLTNNYKNYTIGNKIAKCSTSMLSPKTRPKMLSDETKSIIIEKIYPTYKTFL